MYQKHMASKSSLAKKQQQKSNGCIFMPSDFAHLHGNGVALIYKTSWSGNQAREWDFPQQVFFSVNLDMVWVLPLLHFYASKYLKLL